MTRLLAALTCLAFVGQAQDRPGLPEILSFETTHSGRCPAGWSCNAPDTTAPDGEVTHQGKWSVRIERGEGRSEPFSTINYGMPIEFGGKTIQLRGYIRTEAVQDFVALWMREDSSQGSAGFASMEGTQPVKGTTGWTEYTISLPVNPEARTLVFGFLLSGPGKAWADDLQLLVDGKPLSEAPKRVIPKTILDTDTEFESGSKIKLGSLTQAQTDNLETLGKVWGFLKYHHPAVTTGQRQFDYDLFRVLPPVLAAPDRAGGNAAIVKWIAALGEVGTCKSCNPLRDRDLHLSPDVRWLSDESRLGAELSSLLKSIYANRPGGGKQFYVSMMGGVGNPNFEREMAYARIQLPDVGFQILALYRYWSIIQYWYPYRDVIGEDWSNVLREFIPRVALAQDKDWYQSEMMALIARVHDTHANLWSSLAVRPPVGGCQVPVDIRFVESRPVVGAYTNEELGKASGLKPGDVVETLDGDDVEALVKKWEPYYAASNDPTRLRDIGHNMTRGACGKPAALHIRRGAESLDVSAARVSMDKIDARISGRHDRAGETFQRLSKDVAYLKLSSVKIADVAGYIDSAAGAKGLIVDIRNYPSEFVVFALGQLLVDKPGEFVRFTQGDLANPGAFQWGDPLRLTPQQPHFKGKIVILVDEVSQSQAEYTTMAFRTATGAVVLGSTTAGADGNVSNIALPGGLRTMISGIGVFYPDKKPTQRIGIVPDVEVKPTIAGIREGRDELLEAAIRLIEK